ncbi:golgin subfamily A member 6-like protein 22 isoform X5 [Lytechinus variegatus]|uniref:golgin subfamily A member 6-like protein 22 isoform X5 n=1 Tax=Lytechinus variegatus TaxID=7654 RepID=UPI001BB2CBD0|nr:golgin subfamily A member 6-like protein 22 isoform X5 [Lytechinus variegatus]
MWASNGSFVDRDGEQVYPNKFGGPQPLPSIPSSQTPQPSFDNALVPVGGRRSQLSQLSQIPNGGQLAIGDYQTGRLQQMENRLGVAEQSNRALLEEVVRLQGELKQSHRASEETLQAERQARQQLTENIRASNDLIGQLGARLKRAEERVSDERTAVGALVNHTKQVEQAVLGSQQEILAKRDQQMTKYAELKNELDEANRMREQLERVTTSLVDDVRQVKSRTDASQVEISSLVHDVKERTKRLEEDNRTLRMDHQRKHNENQHHTNQTTAVLRSQLDARLGEVRDVLMDLRNRITTEETERRQQEQNHVIKMNDLQAQLHEVSRKRDESMHALDVVQREREHAADNERLKMHGKIAEIAEEVSKKILSKEIRLREEAQQKFSNIEKYLHAEQAARIAHEQAMREENEKRWAALQKLTEEEVLHVREGQKLDRHKNIGGMNKVSDTMEKMERQAAETRKQLEQVMKAEIKTRQSQDKQIEGKIEDVQEKLGVAISTLQQAIGGINEQVSSSSNVSQDKMSAALEEAKSSQLRAVTDLDARLSTLQSKMATQEETLEDRILAAVEEALGDQSQKAANQIIEDHTENLEKINDWQDTADKKLIQVKERMDELGPEIREMNRTNETLQEDMKGLVDTEAKDRIRDVQMVRQEFTTKYSQLQQQIEAAAQKAAQGGGAPAAAPIPISQKEKLAAGKGGKVDPAALEKVEFLEEELNKVKESMAKVESSVQTVRVHLTRKVDSETKSRREEIRDLQLVFEEFKDKIEPLLKQIEEEEKEKKKDNDEGGSGKEDGEGDDNDGDKENGKDDDKSKEDDNNNDGKDDDKKGDERGGSAGSRK